MELIKRIMLAPAILVLSGCIATIGQVTQTVLNPDGDAAMAIPNVNRAAIEEADLAAVLILSPSTSIASVAVAIQKRESLLLYSSNENRGVTMNGGLIYATLGFGTNLQAVLTQAGDPLVNDTIASQWPESVRRTYQLSGQGTAFTQISATCESRMGATSDIDVVGVMRSVVEVVELCQSDDGLRFNNVHYLDVRNGRVWRTSQWTGPEQQNVQVDIIDQFEPDA